METLRCEYLDELIVELNEIEIGHNYYRALSVASGASRVTSLVKECEAKAKRVLLRTYRRQRQFVEVPQPESIQQVALIHRE